MHEILSIIKSYSNKVKIRFFENTKIAKFIFIGDVTLS